MEVFLLKEVGPLVRNAKHVPCHVREQSGLVPQGGQKTDVLQGQMIQNCQCKVGHLPENAWFPLNSNQYLSAKVAYCHYRGQWIGEISTQSMPLLAESTVLHTGTGRRLMYGIGIWQVQCACCWWMTGGQ